MTHMYFSARAEGRISYGHLGRTNSCFDVLVAMFTSRELRNYRRTALLSMKLNFFLTLTPVHGRVGAYDVLVGGGAGTFFVFVVTFS